MRPTPKRRITVSLPDKRVILQDEKNNILKVYPVYVGSEQYPTLPGHFKVLPEIENLIQDFGYEGPFIPFNEYPDPDVDPTGQVERIAVAGFHGWKYGPEDDEEEKNTPGWKTTTEGCIQMTHEDITEFAAIVEVGDPVLVLDLPVSEIEHLKDDVTMPIPFLEECFSVLTRTPAALDALLRDLPESWITATDGPGTWSPYMVIGHLIQAEKTNWIPRLTSMLEDDPERTFVPFAREPEFHEPEEHPLSALLDQFNTLRRANLEHLRGLNLQPEQLERKGTHPALGAVTVRQLLATWTAHDLAHTVQISRVMARHYKQEVGPWAQFLSVMQ